MLSGVRGGGKKKKDRKLSLPLGLLLSKRTWLLVLTPNALQKKTVLYKMKESLLCSLQQQLAPMVFDNTHLCACLCLPLIQTRRHNPEPHSPRVCGGQEQGRPAWSPRRRAAGSPSKSAGRGGRPATPLFAGVGSSGCACRDMQASEGCLFPTRSCYRTAGISRSQPLAGRGGPAPSAGFGQVTLSAKVSVFAGLTAFDWLGSFQ